MTAPQRERVTRTQRITGSMLWSAWADALGFISELTDEAGLRRRLGGESLTIPVSWRRRVGGRFGVNVPLPAGCYSDDTQLRLATARAISSQGFDVDAFSRIELTVWPAYALGGGRASKAAASNLSKSNVPWFGNFYQGWTTSGGNGAVMRVQPHVWAAADPTSIGQHIVDVVVNTIVTHGHPRAIVGAVLHSLALGHALTLGEVPSCKEWPKLLGQAREVVSMLDSQHEFYSVWRPSWEKETGEIFADSWSRTIDECEQIFETSKVLVEELANCDEAEQDIAYLRYAKNLGLADDTLRGSGTHTTIAALALAAAFPDNPIRSAIVPARALHTDTDTIATLAASITGATATELPSGVLDHMYLSHQAARLASIACGFDTVESFRYPDPLHWSAPRSQLDVVGRLDNRVVLAGLGYLTPKTDSILVSEPMGTNQAHWSWTESDFGQSFLVKHRPEMRRLPVFMRPVRPRNMQLVFDNEKQAPATHVDGYSSDKGTRGYVGLITSPGDSPRRSREGRLDIDQVLSWLEDEDYSERAVGYAFGRVAKYGSLEQLLGFSAALRERLRRRERA